MNAPFLIRIYIIAAVLRLSLVFLTRDLGIGLDDMFQYDMLGRSLAAGNGYRWYMQDDLKQLEPFVQFDLSTAAGYDPEYGLYTSFRAPLYPAFLAAVYYIFGTGSLRFFAARVMQAVFLGAPLAPLTYLASRSLFPRDEHPSRLAAIIAAFYPVLLVYPLGLGTENPFIVLLLISMIFLLRSVDCPSVPNALLSGVFLGLTALTRSVVLFLAFSALVYLFLRNRKYAILTLMTFLILVTPWVVRNSLLHRRLTGIETSMGYNLYLGYHPSGSGSFIFGPSLDLLTIMDDSVRDQTGIKRALEFIRAQPERFFPLALNRLGFFFGLEKRVLVYLYSNNVVGFIPRPLLIMFFIILLLPFMLVSLLASFSLPMLRWSPGSVLLALLFAGYLAPHILILSEDRFHLALVPFLAILASQGWNFLVNKGTRLTANRAAVPVSWALVLCFLINWSFELCRDAGRLAILFSSTGNTAHFPY